MKFWSILLFFFISIGFAPAQDSTKIKILNSGVFIEGEMLGHRLFQSDFGHGLRIGGYVERQLLERVRLKVQLGIRNKEYNHPISIWEDIDNSDTTAILDRYRQYRSSWRITGGIGLNFYYVQTTNFKLFLGLNYLPEFVLSNKVNTEYIISSYKGSNEFPDAARTNTQTPLWNPFWYYQIFELGFGIVFKKTSIEFIIRRGRKNEFSNNFGIRIARNIVDNIK